MNLWFYILMLVVVSIVGGFIISVLQWWCNKSLENDPNSDCNRVMNAIIDAAKKKGREELLEEQRNAGNKCEYCGSMLEEEDKRCSGCGATVRRNKV